MSDVNTPRDYVLDILIINTILVASTVKRSLPRLPRFSVGISNVLMYARALSRIQSIETNARVFSAQQSTLLYTSCEKPKMCGINLKSMNGLRD